MTELYCLYRVRKIIFKVSFILFELKFIDGWQKTDDDDNNDIVSCSSMLEYIKEYIQMLLLLLQASVILRKKCLRCIWCTLKMFITLLRPSCGPYWIYFEESLPSTIVKKRLRTKYRALSLTVNTV